MNERYDFYQVNAFAKEAFCGNPAAICVMSEWPADRIMQGMAADNNLSETAFLKPDGQDYEIRWFTPATEVALCGHATLASAHVVFQYLQPQRPELVFHTRYSGDLFLYPEENQVTMDLPRIPVERKVNTHGLDKLPVPVTAVYEGDKLILVLEDEQAVKNFNANADLLATLHEFGVGLTAPADDPEVDFVSRFFAPNAGVPEDPVTGSLYCSLGSLWEHKLDQSTLTGRQLSARGGGVTVTMRPERALITGSARTVIQGEYYL